MRRYFVSIVALLYLTLMCLNFVLTAALLPLYLVPSGWSVYITGTVGCAAAVGAIWGLYVYVGHTALAKFVRRYGNSWLGVERAN